ncbi:hypothetical protein SPBR_00644 [Sporothrix brasiliensis 5110]|uniref:Uncharacterized protein n=1 Tax=Sporothrix brasiliensis 5110 TaxID=1398154 RepID=A0A0C2IM40_9PEZI|nr:uncharacterized protein SPBR_00644 [Sporothrix brasiliensis 5110]KIH90121.1 hypothetical protein SPBR_00644 [Sporothrix brasiliensis 5110]
MNYTRKRNVESPSTPNEAVVERLGRIEALLEEQSQKLERLYLRGLPSSNFDGPHLSLSSNVSIDASATGAEPSEVTDANISSTGSLPVPRLPMHLAPEFAAHATTSHGGITATRASGASSTSPPMPAPVPSSIRYGQQYTRAYARIWLLN